MIQADTRFSLHPVPAIAFGAGRIGAIADDVSALAPTAKTVCMIVDGPLHSMGISAPAIAALEGAGLRVSVFDSILGEPSERVMEAACDFLRAADADVVVSMGGGSALDIGKATGLISVTGDSPLAYAEGAKPLPPRGRPAICVPTTAGTGSETSSTNMLQRNDGRKVWIWGPETKPDLVILDPELTVSLPPHLTAWTGLDALVHALESCTNRNATPANSLYAHRALGLIAGALESAVDKPDDLAARGAMLLGSAYAGAAIDNAGCAMAHNISHALAALDHIHHGLATALGMGVVFDWQVDGDADGLFADAAAACGLGRDARELADWYAELLARLNVRSLPAAFQAFSPADLLREMSEPNCTPMRDSNTRPVSAEDSERFAHATLALVEGAAA